jgi:hypothetical protein
MTWEQSICILEIVKELSEGTDHIMPIFVHKARWMGKYSCMEFEFSIISSDLSCKIIVAISYGLQLCLRNTQFGMSEWLYKVEDEFIDMYVVLAFTTASQRVCM